MTGSDTHADTIREADAAVALRCALMSSLAVTGPLYTHETYDEGMAALDALVAEVERERARADRAEAALQAILDLRMEEGMTMARSTSRARDSMREIARAALSAGSGGRETTP